jgi:hypothetical protein
MIAGNGKTMVKEPVLGPGDRAGASSLVEAAGRLVRQLRPARSAICCHAPIFFDIDDGNHLTTDSDGVELAGPEAARIEALRALPEMALGVLPDGNVRTLVATVRTVDGPVFFLASLTLKCEWFEWSD